MLTIKDIDYLADLINKGYKPSIYYVANLLETREGYLDELIYKSVPKYKVVRINVTKIENAYFELLRCQQNPDAFHIEEEDCFYSPTDRYRHYYIVPNEPESFDKAFNSRMPSIVYGMKKTLYRAGELEQDFVMPSPVKEIYTNALSFMDLSETEAENAYEQGELDWKYYKIPNGGKEINGLNFKYITSDYYILDIENFPRTEKPLINVNQKTAYFMSNEEAQNAIAQYEA